MFEQRRTERSVSVGTMQSWMRDNFDALADRPLNEIILPGTHDSAAYVLAPEDGVNRRDWLLNLLARFGKPCIAPWTLTQHDCVYRQLSESGVRFLDVRVAWDDQRKDFSTSHTFACVPLKAVLHDIVDFLAQNTGETVVLSVRPDWPHRNQFSPPICAALLATLSSTCGRYLYPRQAQLPQLRQLIATDRRLIVFVEGLTNRPTLTCTTAKVPALRQDDIWVSAGCRCLWADRDTPEGTVSGLLEMIAKLRRDGGITSAAVWYISAAVTPTARSVIRDILANPRRAGLRRLASQLQAKELPRLLGEGLAGFGAVCLDHPSPQAMAAIVRLNFPTGKPMYPLPPL